MTDVVQAIRDFIEKRVRATEFESNHKFAKDSSTLQKTITSEQGINIALDAVLFALSQRPVPSQVVNTIDHTLKVPGDFDQTVVENVNKRLIAHLAQQGYQVFAPETFMIPTSSSGINIWIDEQVFNAAEKCRDTNGYLEAVKQQDAADIARGAAACVAKDRNALIGNLRAAGYVVISNEEWSGMWSAAFDLSCAVSALLDIYHDEGSECGDFQSAVAGIKVLNTAAATTFENMRQPS